MIKIEWNNLCYYQFEAFPQNEVVHAVFTRLGGVSQEPWSSLNLGGSNGDSPDHIINNRRKIFEAVKRPEESLYDVWQVHGSDALCANQPRSFSSPHVRADIVITDNVNVTLMMRFADCVPILLYDPRKKVVGIVHAGWQGTVHKAVGSAISIVCRRYGSKPVDIIAAIGPSIGPDHYVVKEDVSAKVLASFGKETKSLLKKRDGKLYFDMWAANTITLKQSGVREIENASICTACNTKEWFSHRGENGRTGRFGVILGLADS